MIQNELGCCHVLPNIFNSTAAVSFVLKLVVMITKDAIKKFKLIIYLLYYNT
jgi:hypothetical protein